MFSKKCLIHNENQGWMDRFEITAGYADLELQVLGANGNTQVIGFYNGSSGWTIANYANLPKGTIVFNNQDHKTYEKTGAVGVDTWVASAARS
jgi:hypothetical protein